MNAMTVRGLIRRYAAAGSVQFSFHAQLRAKQRHIRPQEILNGLKHVVRVSPGDDVGTWRAVLPGDIVAVVALRDGVLTITVYGGN